MNIFLIPDLSCILTSNVSPFLMSASAHYQCGSCQFPCKSPVISQPTVRISLLYCNMIECAKKFIATFSLSLYVQLDHLLCGGILAIFMTCASCLIATIKFCCTISLRLHPKVFHHFILGIEVIVIQIRRPRG